jgi:hypothetical protein
VGVYVCLYILGDCFEKMGVLFSHGGKKKGGKETKKRKPDPDQCFPARRLPPFARNRSLVTAFCSPATVAASRRPPFRGQSSQPATSLPSKSLPCPFGLSAPPPLPGLRRSRPLQRFWPVALPLPGSACRCQRSPLPSGTFASLGIKAFNRVCCLPVHLTNPPDFLSLPAARPD